LSCIIIILSSYYTIHVHLKAINHYLETFMHKNRGIHLDLFSQVPLNVSETLEPGSRLTDLFCISSYDKSLRDGYYNISFFLQMTFIYKNGYTRRSCRRRIILLFPSTLKQYFVYKTVHLTCNTYYASKFM